MHGGIYRFKCSTGSCSQTPGFEVFTWDADIEKVTCPLCGLQAERIISRSRNAEPPTMYSEAAGIHPSQIPEALARFPNHRFTPDGRMIFDSQREKDRVLKDIGFVDHKD